MRKWVSVAIALAALVYTHGAVAQTPPGVYNDFAEDGVLSCGHSRAALKGALNDASIHQYGDPLTFIGLKLAIRKQLAGSCRRQERTPAFFGSAGGTSPSGSGPPPETATRKPGGNAKTRPNEAKPSFDEPTADGDDAEAEAAGVAQDGWMVLLAVVLLLLTLGSGGWAARRAFTD